MGASEKDGLLPREMILRELRALAASSVPGTRMPSENAVAARFKTARMTAYWAFRRLAEEGLIERRRGSGTFVKGMRTVTFLLPAPDFIARKGHNEGIAREQLAGVLRAACELNLRVETLVGSPVNDPNRLDYGRLEQLSSGSMVVVSPWYANCFPMLSEHRVRTALLSNQSRIHGYEGCTRDWFRLEADRERALGRMAEMLYKAGCRKFAAASAHISVKEPRSGCIYQRALSEYCDATLCRVKLPASGFASSREERAALRAVLEEAYGRWRFDALILDTSAVIFGTDIHEFCGLPRSVRIFGINLLSEQLDLEEPFACCRAPYEKMGYEAVHLLAHSARGGVRRQYDYIFQHTESLNR